MFSKTMLGALLLCIIPLNIALPQTIDDLADPNCGVILRKSVYDIQTSKSSSSYKELVLYDWCTIDIGSEAEASSHNFNMNIVYEGIGIGVNDADRFSKALDWKKQNCGVYKAGVDKAAISSEFKATINTPFALALVEAWRACVSNPLGLHCTAASSGGSTINYYARYIPPVAGGRSPRVRSSFASNAERLTTDSDKNIVFPVHTVVTPGGISASFRRLDPNQDVSFSVDLDGGVGSCQPLAVPAAPRYVITADLKMTGERLVSTTYSQSATQGHFQCKGVNVPSAINNFCVPDDETLDANSISVVPNPQNPYSAAAGHNCFLPMLVNFSISGKCANIAINVPECPVPAFVANPEGQACAWALAHGTPYTAKIKGDKWVRNYSSGTINCVEPDYSGGLWDKCSLQQPPADVRSPVVEFDVIIVDRRGGAVAAKLNQNTTTSGQFAAFWDLPRSKLVVTLP